ncbi:MAG: ATP-dependent Clp protease adaptor ClpS [Deltaproteobacteria bacterium]
MSQRGPPDGGADTVTRTRSQPKTRPPPLYKVLLHNDDYTTMEFVVSVLETVFSLPPPAAIQVMLAIHHRGVGVAGVYPHDIAETKANRVMELARAAEYPLLCTVEPE